MVYRHTVTCTYVASVENGTVFTGHMVFLPKCQTTTATTSKSMYILAIAYAISVLFFYKFCFCFLGGVAEDQFPCENQDMYTVHKLQVYSLIITSLNLYPVMHHPVFSC